MIKFIKKSSGDELATFLNTVEVVAIVSETSAFYRDIKSIVPSTKSTVVEVKPDGEKTVTEYKDGAKVEAKP